METLHELRFEVKSFDNLLSSLLSGCDLAQPEALVEVICANWHNGQRFVDIELSLLIKYQIVALAKFGIDKLNTPARVHNEIGVGARVLWDPAHINEKRCS